MEDNLYAGLSIVRNDSLQIERVDSLTTIMRIVWKSDCEYYLIPVKVDNRKYQYVLGDTLLVQIVTILSDSTFICSAIKNLDTTQYVMVKRAE